MNNWFYRVSWFIGRTLLWLLFGLKSIGKNHVPVEGPVIVAANHQSYFDPPLVAAALNREMHFFAKKELFSMFLLGWLIRPYNTIPVRRGAYDPSALSRVLEVLSNRGGLIIFPEGTRGDGREFLRPKPGIGFIAKRTRAPIVPAYVYRANQLWGALVARRRVQVLFGTPISAEEIDRFADDKDGYQSLAECVMERIGQLRNVVFST
jgi:1-acyl-sn-glycerol-3-phosphate acyltransferase